MVADPTENGSLVSATRCLRCGKLKEEVAFL